MLYELLMLTLIAHEPHSVRHVGIYATAGGCIEEGEVLDRKLNSLPHVEAAGSRVVFTCVEFIEPANET